MRPLVLLAVAAAFFGSAECAVAKQIRSFKVGAWSGGAYTNDQTKKFSHCTGLAPYKNGVNLLFMVTRNYQWAVGFASPQFDVPKGQTIKLALSMDGGAPTKVNAYAIDHDFLRVELSPTAELFNRFRSGGQLTLIGNDKTLTFNLTNTSKLLPALVDCVKVALTPPKMQNSAVASTAAPKAVVPEAQRTDNRAEATAIVANLLSQAGISGFQLVPASQVNGGVTGEVSWTSPAASGSLMILAADDEIKGPADTAPILIAMAAKFCKGQFMSGALPEEANGTQARVFTSCKSDKSTRTTYFLTMSRKAGGHYVFSTVSDGIGGEDPAKDADTQIRSVAYKVLPK